MYDTKLPVWGVAISLLLAAIYIIPGGFIYAWSAQTVRRHVPCGAGGDLLIRAIIIQITINIIAELIPGYAFEGRPIANMVSAGPLIDVRPHAHAVLPVRLNHPLAGFQGHLGSKLDQWHLFCPRPQARPLYEGPTACLLCR